MQPSFATLWANHPTIKGDDALLDKDVYKDQCAINVGATFIRSSLSLESFPGVYSWQKDRPKYPIRAQELASWLDSGKSGFMSRTEKYSGKEGFEKIAKRTGIVFVQNYWGAGRQGDHIDLWNGSRMTERMSYFRIQWHLSLEGVFTDMRLAQAIWFWQVQ
ncbi:Type VI secretion system (T6SS), amidase effector protein 4 [Variovorax sp. NFACC28]|nr:Type VI secretion system (T6SS), amidase effector protein 4 [Variovorax sp. NFACC28]SEG52158.1 Type VI secretion system (T6SS), amidase effector protein 4 [Variovorax sp. NFACC29]SFC18037.1 Type VI secretion system (T6SS), amidase effector protein 4 [Variovorax sp. NFACC26]SFH00429.1 Type VI secretion system (T6SS), amidase effector protein 4 [Variovorax sp. NFACC27]